MSKGFASLFTNMFYRIFRLFFVALQSLIATSLFSQQATVCGHVVEAATNSPIIGARVIVQNTSLGSVTDIDGRFSMSLDPGKYQLLISAFSFQTVMLDSVVVTSNDTLQLALKMKQHETQIAQVTIQASKKYNSDVALNNLRKKSLNAIDAIAASSIAKTGDSDAAGALTRIPGVSLIDGKYAYIRGIGDRYNKTLLNGMDIPGLDPDKNSIQLDIIPTSILDNIIIHKTFIAELPADFAGGLIDVNIKTVPDKQLAGASASIGYNPFSHFKKGYLTHSGSKTDFWGFDNGKREIPANTNIPFYAKIISNPAGAEAARYKEVLSKFNPNMAAYKKMSGLDYGFNAYYGNRKMFSNHTLGYLTMISYNNQTEFYQHTEYKRYGLKSNADVFEMELREHQKGSFGVNNVTLNAMLGLGLYASQSTYSFHILHLQNGESKSGIFDFESNNQGAIFSAIQHNLEYSQRSMTNGQFNGKHTFGKKQNWESTWGVATTFSTIKDPDIRFTRYRTQQSGFSIGTETGFPERIWRNMQEINVVAKTDMKATFTLFGNTGEAKFGFNNTYKKRDFTIQSFMVNVRNLELTGNPDELFAPENLWPYQQDIARGTTIEPTFLPNNPNSFRSNVNNVALYVSTTFAPAKPLKIILGFRTEYYEQIYTGRDQTGNHILNNDAVLRNFGYFPSLNLIYSITEKHQLRAAYGKTIARPSFKEMSYAEIADPLTGRVFIGGLFKDEDNGTGTVYWDGNLRSSTIHNVDIRWDFYPTSKQTISASVFFKHFTDPIEMVQYASQESAFQPRNVGMGRIFGAELECKLSLGYITKKLSGLSFAANMTYVNSRIKLSETEKLSKANNAKVGEQMKSYRQMAGQTPIMLNLGLMYHRSDDEVFNNFDVGIFYNLQGSTLLYVGMVDRPDIYSSPFHSLNFTLNKKLGKKAQWSIGLKISNMLNDKRESVYKAFKSDNQLFSRLTPGVTSTLKVGYTF